MKSLLRPIFNRIARLLGILELQTRVTNISQQVEQISQDSITYQNALRREIEEVERLISNRLENLVFAHTQEALRSTANMISTTSQEVLASAHAHTEAFTVERLNAAQQAVVDFLLAHLDSVLMGQRAETEMLMTTLRRDIDLLRSVVRATSHPHPQPDVVDVVGSKKSIDDAMYVALEDHFRGSQELIRDRQMAYLPYIEGQIDEQYPLVDFGCGRGEWLELLKSSNIPSRGFDSNYVCVDECRTKGLRVDIGDLHQILQTMPDSTAGAITFFQVFEHLPFGVLEEVIRNCRRVLRPGGILIAEVPNSENLSVGSSTFWIDPTHERPLHPEVLKFLVTKLGFSSVSGIYSTPLKAFPDLGSTGPIQDAVNEIYAKLFGPGDFAVIATA